MLNLFVPITKVDAAQRLVYGVIAEEIADKSGEIFDYESSKPNFETWSGEIEKATNGKSLGNLRVMHANKAAGKLTSLAFDDGARSIEAVAKVVDDAEWVKVLEGVYTGFSIGGRYEKRWPDPANGDLMRYTAVPAEVSLVDSPCIPSATFSMVKLDGSIECRAFKPPVPQVSQVWQAQDGATFKTKSAAIAHTERLGHRVLAKDTGQVVRLAALLQELGWLYAEVAGEAETEQDNSQIPDELKAVILRLAGVLSDMAEEEGGEASEDNEDDTQEKTSPADADDSAAEDRPDDLALAAGIEAGRAALAKLAADNETLSKAMADTIPLIQALQQRIEKLEAEPMPGGPARLHVVSKEDDGRAAADYLGKAGPDALATAIIKLAQRSPNRNFRPDAFV